MPWKLTTDRNEYMRQLFCWRDCERCGKEKVWGHFCRGCYLARAALRSLIEHDRRARSIYFEKPLWPYKDCEHIVRKIKRQINTMTNAI